jgi:nucleotide-binding universal stress UspA family protein
MGNQLKKSIKNNKVILIPTDFSAVAENAIVHGLEMAQSLQYKACLLHVYQNQPDTIYNKEDDAYQHAVQELLKCKSRYEQNYPVKIETLIREGNLFKVFNMTAAEIKPGLMIMGTHGKQGLQHLFGSYALRVVLDSPCSVMVVRDRPVNKYYRRIVLPVNCEVDPCQMTEWVLRINKIHGPEIFLMEAIESHSDRSSITKGIAMQIISSLKEEKIACRLTRAESSDNFFNQFMAFSNANHADLIITMIRPADDSPGYNFSDWNERLMFNPDGIPVLFIDRG